MREVLQDPSTPPGFRSRRNMRTAVSKKIVRGYRHPLNGYWYFYDEELQEDFKRLREGVRR